VCFTVFFSLQLAFLFSGFFLFFFAFLTIIAIAVVTVGLVGFPNAIPKG
jgi:hypothetical protein